MSKKVQFTRRANGEGSVYQIKDGRYGAAISLGKDETGKRLRHVETGKTEQDAIQKMQLWLAQNGYMGPQTVVINGQSTVEEFVENFRLNDLKASNISDVTFESYSYALKHFEQFFKGQKIGIIGVNDLKCFFIWIVNCQEVDGTYKYSQATLKLTKYIVGRMFSNAVEENYLQKNPMDNAKLKSMLKNLKSKKRTPDVESLTQEEIGILKNALMKNKIVYPVIALMSVTGMRTQEALGLQWSDIDFENATIHIQRAVTEEITWDSHGNKISSKSVLGPTKRGTSDREIPVPDMVINLLKEWRATAPFISKTQLGESDRVFGNSKSPSWTYAGFRSSVNRTLQKADSGIDSLRLHRLRHTVATMMSNEPDANVYHIMQLLGHTQIKTTQKYIDKQTQERGKKNKELMGRLSAKVGLCG